MNPLDSVGVTGRSNPVESATVAGRLGHRLASPGATRPDARSAVANDRCSGRRYGRNIELRVGARRFMALEREHHCPNCDESQQFTRLASTLLHLGLKTKWVCPECDYRFVLVGDAIDTSA